MGHKVNPVGLRLGVNRTWDSRWYAANEQYRDLLIEDLKIRDFLHKRLKQAGISKIVIERPAKKARISIHTARPGVVIGKKGQEIEALRKSLAKMTTGDVHLNIVEIRKPEIDARLVAALQRSIAGEPGAILAPATAAAPFRIRASMQPQASSASSVSCCGWASPSWSPREVG